MENCDFETELNREFKNAHLEELSVCKKKD